VWRAASGPLASLPRRRSVASAETPREENNKAMKNSLKVFALIAIGLALLSTTGCDKLRARDQLNKGVAAYKNAKYEEAIDHFQQAVSLDPNLIVARMYLATAYAQQYIPGVDAPDNVRMAEQAIDQYQHVLQASPNKELQINSNKGIAYLYLQQKKFDDAKTAYRKAMELDPNDPEVYYSVGVIDWTQTYQPRMEARAKLGLKPEENLNPKNKEEMKACGELKEKNAANIQEGIDALKKALDLRPDYDDAMAYMNLMYREKADVECDDLAARAADLKTADEWVDKTMATKKAKAEKQPGAQGITLDQPK
jgi:tetratricopeptide (TPR) repeat protein